MFSFSGLSDVGQVRSSNQDSGFAGAYLLAVADGMGGHAGGDVASHIAITHVARLNKSYASVSTAKRALRENILAANKMIVDVVPNYPQLSGLGTTLSAVLLVGNRAVIAHIGDSRIYRLRDGELTQLSKDHTFVQRLVDSGQITADEAMYHPRRSVLMRVLGDVDAAPDLDIFDVDVRETDLWLLCSDGLTGVLRDHEITTLLTRTSDLSSTCRSVVEASLNYGAPDNVTVVLGRRDASLASSAELVGSVATPSPLKNLETTTRVTDIIARPPSKAMPVTTGGIALPELAQEVPTHADAREASVLRGTRRRRIGLITSLVGLVIVITGAGAAFFSWTQSHYYLGAGSSSVVINQGMPGDILGIPLSHRFSDTHIALSNLTAYQRSQIESTVTFDSLDAALAAAQQLSGAGK